MITMVVAASTGAATLVCAQSIEAGSEIGVEIPSQSLSSALRQLAETSGLQLVYDTRITDGRTSPAVSGRMSARAALSALLAGSGLSVQFSGDRSAIISAPTGSADGSDEGVRSVGVVTVEGVGGHIPFGDRLSPLNGVNGSRDVEATEGSGSYTTGAVTVASKIPQTLRETPASVTVMTAQQIEDQSLLTVRDVLDKLTGVTVLTGGNTEEFNFASRGFDISTIRIDGGAPLAFNLNNRPVIDMSEFDSVQLFRGADGLYGGYGDPGGAINLVRKRPLDHRQMTLELDVGSWSHFRESIDVTGPLTASGNLRGRLVLTQTDKKQFFDIAESQKSSIYGVLEYDLGPSTLLTAGGNFISEENITNQGGVPRYFNGDLIDFPRSTCFCVPWAYDDAKRTEAFVILDHQFNTDISSRLNITYNNQEVDSLIQVLTSVVPLTGPAEGQFGGAASYNPVKQLAVDFSTTAGFNLFGRRHSIVAGASYQNIDNAGADFLFYSSRTVPNIFDFDPADYPEPPRPEPYSQTVRNETDVYIAYLNARLQLLSNLHLTAGINYTSYVNNQSFRVSYDPLVQVAPELTDDTVSEPVIGLTYDLPRNFTLYGSFQKIYKPQTNLRYANLDFTPDPVTGSNEEIGIKWASDTGGLNASLSLYDIEQNGFLVQDFTTGEILPEVRSATSRGADFEIAGQVLPGLQVSFGYTFNENEETAFGQKGPKSTHTPKHIVKSWMTYRGTEGRPLNRFVLGGGVYYQSDAYHQGFLCVDPPSNDPNAFCSAFVPYAFTTEGYATLAARIGYQLTENVEISLSGDNLTDERRISTNRGQSIAAYNYYIAPASFLLSLRARW